MRSFLADEVPEVVETFAGSSIAADDARRFDSYARFADEQRRLDDEALAARLAVLDAHSPAVDPAPQGVVHRPVGEWRPGAELARVAVVAFSLWLAVVAVVVIVGVVVTAAQS